MNDNFTLEEALTGISSYLAEKHEAAVAEESAAEVNIDAYRLATYEAFEAGEITAEEKTEILSILTELAEDDTDDADQVTLEEVEQELDNYLEESADVDIFKKFKASSDDIRAKIASAKGNIKDGEIAAAKKDIKDARSSVSECRKYVKNMPENKLETAASIVTAMAGGAAINHLLNRVFLGKKMANNKFGKVTDAATGLGTGITTVMKAKETGTADATRQSILALLKIFDQKLDKLEKKLG